MLFVKYFSSQTSQTMCICMQRSILSGFYRSVYCLPGDTLLLESHGYSAPAEVKVMLSQSQRVGCDVNESNDILISVSHVIKSLDVAA